MYNAVGDHMNYLLVFLVDILLALDFVLQKKYQADAGADVLAGLRFNMLSGLAATVIFFAATGFSITFSAFSLLCAAGMALCLIAYTLLGFQILREANTATYSVFLMSGGMVLPYIFGIMALGEELTLFRVIGIVVILVAVFLSANGKLRFSPKLIFLCMTVFFLNGMVSIISKVHQVNADYVSVSSTAFTMYAYALKCIFSALALVFWKNKQKKGATRKSLLHVKRLLLIVCLSAAVSGGSYLLQLTCAKTMAASVLYPLVTGGSIVVTALAGKICFREKQGKAGWISIALCVAGTAFFL